MSKIASFTGHRPDKFSFKYDEQHINCIKLKYTLINEIEKLYSKGVKIFLTGCALGVDIWCGEIVLNLMQIYDDIQLYCILPCKNQDKIWNDSYKKRFENLINNCTKSILIQQDYSKDCFFKRNKYLVDKANIILAVYNISLNKSGTKNTLNYAIKENKETIIIDGNTLDIYKTYKYFL